MSRLALTAIVSSAAYLALAIWGAGGVSAFLARPARLAVALVFVALVVIALFSRGNLSPGEREDRSNRWIIAALGGLGVLSAYIPPYTERIGLWVLDGDAVRWLGVALFALGGALRLGPVFVLGRRFSGLVAIQRDHALVTGGLYRTIRHPSYLGLLINALGWALTFRSGVGIVLVALMVVPLVARIRSEEALLASQFGADYAAYRARTWRIIPGLY